MSEKLSKEKKKGVYRYGVRAGLFTSFTSALILFVVLIFGYDFVVKEAATLSLMMGIFIFIITYTTVYYLSYKRLKTIERLMKNISRKRFMEYDEVSSRKKDEIDYLVKQGIKSSRTIEREIQRLNRIENYRKEFIGDISHELKTPIFAIQGFIETLLNGALEDEEVNRDFLRKTMRNVNRLIYLTKDLMEISKLETGELKSEIEEINLYESINDILESLNYKAEKLLILNQ